MPSIAPPAEGCEYHRQPARGPAARLLWLYQRIKYALIAIGGEPTFVAVGAEVRPADKADAGPAEKKISFVRNILNLSTQNEAGEFHKVYWRN